LYKRECEEQVLLEELPSTYRVNTMSPMNEHTILYSLEDELQREVSIYDEESVRLALSA